MTELGREYGDGLYALCAEENLTDEVLMQLAMLREQFRLEKDFIRLLSNTALPKQERTQILDKALRGQVHPYVLNFLKILCERGALGDFESCEQAYRQRYNRENGVAEATVTTGAALSAPERDKLLARLNQLTGRKVHLTEKVDASLLGGVLLEVDGKRYDNTLRHRLAEIRQALKAAD